MTKTIDSLFNAILKDCTYISDGVLNDYFGNENIYNEVSVKLIYGIYSGMIKTKGVSKELFENCFLTNRLDELIHTKAKYHKSGYYAQFCTNNIKIGKTYMGNSGVPELFIKDDNHCPSCEESGYITDCQYLSFMSPDCINCGIFMCKRCVIMTDDVGICQKCK